MVQALDELLELPPLVAHGPGAAGRLRRGQRRDDPDDPDPDPRGDVVGVGHAAGADLDQEEQPQGLASASTGIAMVISIRGVAGRPQQRLGRRDVRDAGLAAGLQLQGREHHRDLVQRVGHPRQVGLEELRLQGVVALVVPLDLDLGELVGQLGLLLLELRQGQLGDLQVAPGLVGDGVVLPRPLTVPLATCSRSSGSFETR